MEMNQVHGIARRLVQAHGLRAEAEAAHQLHEAENQGDEAKSDLWRRVRAAVKDMKGAHQS